MSKLPVLRNIEENFDWLSYVEQNYSTKRTSRGEVRICCPICGDDKYKCYINPDRHVFNCFKCDFKTGKFDVFDFVATTEHISRGAAIKQLMLVYKGTTPSDLADALKNRMNPSYMFAEEQGIRLVSMPTGALRLKPGQGQEFWDYLMYGRGLTEAEIMQANTHYVPAESLVVYNSNGRKVGDIGKRFLWPIYGGDNDLVSWIARTIAPNYSFGDKYLNCPDADQSKTFWPYVPPREKEVVLVEGVLDAMALRRAGFNAYACFGKHVSPTQIKLLQLWGVTSVVVFFDKKDAKKEITRSAETLKNCFSEVFVLNQTNWPKNLDAGDCLLREDGNDMIREVLADRVSVSSLRFAKWKLEY